MEQIKKESADGVYPSPHYPLTLRMYPVKKITNDVFYLLILCNERRKKTNIVS